MANRLKDYFPPHKGKKGGAGGDRCISGLKNHFLQLGTRTEGRIP